MAVVNLKSQVITDQDASPVVKTSPLEVGGVIREAIGVVQTNSDDSANSTYRMVRLPSRARVTQVLISSDDAGTTGDTDIGLYLSDEGAVEDADFFASALDINTAALEHSDVTYESGVVGPEDMSKRLWEQLGKTTDPDVFYDVALTLTEAVTAATDIALKVRYVLDE